MYSWICADAAALGRRGSETGAGGLSGEHAGLTSRRQLSLGLMTIRVPRELG
jgi:hypothetical protein